MELFDIDLHNVFPYKYIFNPSIVRNNDGTFKLICRLQNHEEEGLLGICELNQNYKPISPAQLVKASPLQNSEVMLEDPRIFSHNDKVYIGYVEASPSSLYLIYTVFGELKNNTILNPVILDYKKNYQAFRKISRYSKNSDKKVLPQKEWLIEKNWQFFICGERHFCIYEAGQQQSIFQFDAHKGTIIQEFRTFYDLPWKYGRISGGASPVLFHDNHYYSFFHSWTNWDTPAEQRNWQQRKYHIGVYVFESVPPFRIKRISSVPILSGSDKDSLAPSGHSVIFPGSAIYDDSKDEWLIAIGWNDHSSKLLTVSHTEIEQYLVSVSSITGPQVLAKRLGSLINKLQNKLRFKKVGA